MHIEGIPEGWELVRIGKPVINVDWVIDADGNAKLCDYQIEYHNRPIIRKIEKPKQYRPFANAAEFEPYRDRWIQRSDKRDSQNTIPSGCFRVTAYNDHHFWTADSLTTTYQEAFDAGKKFDDGTPFGIETT